MKKLSGTERLSDENILSLGRKLHLTPLTQCFIGITQEKEYRDDALSYRELIVRLLETMEASRTERRLNRQVAGLGLTHPDAVIENMLFESRTGLSPRMARELNTCEWVRHKWNLIITGPSGSGKTWICDCLAASARRLGLKTAVLRWSSLMARLAVLSADDFEHMAAELMNTDLIYIDRFVSGIPSPECEALPGHLVDRIDGKAAVMINSQVARQDWKKRFSDPVIADGIITRLTGGYAQILTIDSTVSMRTLDPQNAGSGWSPCTDDSAPGTLQGTGNHGETCLGGGTGGTGTPGTLSTLQGTGTLSTLNENGDEEKN